MMLGLLFLKIQNKMVSTPLNSICLLLMASFVTFTIPVAESLSPVILIPGDGGSQMDAKLNKSSVVHYLCQKTSDYYNIWLNKELLVPLIIDCWIDNIKLHYDNVTRKTYNAEGVSIRIPGWGDPEPVEWLDPSHASVGAYFKDIAEALVSVGYARNFSIRGAPYDFRKAPNENEDFLEKLKGLVEETFAANNNSQVTLLSHSMGGPMTLHFLQKQSSQWKKKYIKSFVTLAAPWGGAVKAVKVFAIGDNLGSFALSEKVLRQEQITSPSLAWLLPSPLFWKESEVLIQTDKFNYTIKDLDKFFGDIDYPTGWEMRKDTLEYSTDFTPPGVDLYCLYGLGVPTVERLVYKPGTWLDGYPTLVNGDGDGTVNIRSLQGCQHWSPKRRKFWRPLTDLRKVEHEEFSNVDHMGILSDTRVIAYLKELLNH